MSVAANALSVAVRRGGGVSAVARKLEVDQTTVSQWLRRRQVSHRKALALANLTGVSIHRLRPDIFGRAKRSTQGTR